jgi:hypothetical protein
LSNDKSRLASCWSRRLEHRLQILPANKKLRLEAAEISKTLMTNSMQRKLLDYYTMAERRKYLPEAVFLNFYGA